MHAPKHAHTHTHPVINSQDRERSCNSQDLCYLSHTAWLQIIIEDQFQCSIYLDMFTEPVSTPCAHNFCKVCISRCWDTTDLCQCPMCKHKYFPRPELLVNTFISEMAAQFRRSVQVEALGSPNQSLTESGEVACDVCTGTKLKALKSCLECLTSFCEIHLQPHQRVAGMKRHKLIDPVENLEDRLCKKHDRLLELFCRTDQTCVCQFCTETDHKTHHIVPLEEEFGERKAQLGKTEAQVQQMIQERLQKVQKIKHSVEFRKRDTEREITGSVQQTVWRSSMLWCVPLKENEFSSGRFYYEVQVEGKTWWGLGVARKSTNRNGWLPLTPENGFWTLGLKNGNHQHWYCANTITSTRPSSPAIPRHPKKWGCLWIMRRV
uniref:Uncharacterized protein n=1 Tax=Hucho hucho TaxID=62062 RepID=A0A4W5N9Y5_9TELE